MNKSRNAGLRRYAVALFLLWGGAVQAHSGGDNAVQAELGEQDAIWQHMTVQVRHSLAPQILIANHGQQTLEILDQNGVAFVRIEPQGVFANVTAAAWYNTYSTAGLSVPKKARDPDTPPQWQQVSEQSQWGWFDPRLASTDVPPPPGAQTQHVSQTFAAWQIPARIDGAPVSLRGHYRYTPPQTRSRQARLRNENLAQNGIGVQLIPGPVDAFMLQNHTDQSVTVMGYAGEPFLKIGPDAVQANLSSPTWREWGRVSLSADSPDEQVSWQRVAGGSTFTWLDPRTQITDEQAAASQWQIPVQVGEQSLALAGESRWLAPAMPAMGDGHDHANMAGIEAGQPLPKLKVQALADTVSGWNIHIQVDNFRFAPEHVNQDHQPGEGHAHIYVDGQKVARVYGPWYHLSLNGQPAQQLRVELNANTHAPLLHQGKPIAATVSLQQP